MTASAVFFFVVMKDFLYHHGIRGQKWGVKNGPPYPLGGGDYSDSERTAILKERRKKYSIYNKKHFDQTIGSKTTLNTLSWDPNRTKDADMFFAAYTSRDKHEYNAMFNRPMKQPVTDSDGKEIGYDTFLKYRIKNQTVTEMKVASEDSGAKVFADLYKKDRDFYNFVTDPERMRSYFVDDRLKFRGYREANKALTAVQEGSRVTFDDIKKVYRMFNYTIPFDGSGDKRKGSDMAIQRAKFFKALKAEGYGAVLDTNDAIYGGFKAQSPVIVFDMSSVVLQSAMRVTKADKMFSQAVYAGRKALGF